MTPSEKYNKKVIGQIVAQISGVVSENGVQKKIVFPEDTFEVIEIKNTPNGTKIYICNNWHKDNMPQFVPECFVKKFSPIK